MKGIQDLFDELIKQYNLRAITIDDITWYGINDLPIREPRKIFSDLRKQNEENFINNNTKLITNSDVASNSPRNFDKVNNRGETFGTEDMLIYLVQKSHMTISEKEEYLKLFNKNIIYTRQEVDFFRAIRRSIKTF